MPRMALVAFWWLLVGLFILSWPSDFWYLALTWGPMGIVCSGARPGLRVAALRLEFTGAGSPACQESVLHRSSVSRSCCWSP